MSWYYAENGQQVGPILDADFESLVLQGIVRDDTLVWKEGMANWQPYERVKPKADSALPAPPPSVAGSSSAAATTTAMGTVDEVVCAECGKRFTKDNAIQYGTTWVCATCKPIFVQRLREGAPIPRSGVAWISEEDLLARDYRVEIGDSLERAWNVFGSNAGTIIGTTLVVFVAAAICWVVSALLGLVLPYANAALSFVYSGPLLGGFLWFFLRLARGEPAGVGDAFAGFSKCGVQLMLTSLVQGLLNMLCLLPVLIVVGISGLTAAVRRGGLPSMGPIQIVSAVLLGFVGVAALVYLNTLWTHSLLLVIDKGYSFWPAMQLSRRLVSKRWWMTLLFLIVAGTISSAGAIACLVGLIVSMPLYYGMRVSFYDDNFRDLARAS
jgi:hypothetical protein